jgi:TPR repeat protein
MYNLGMMCLHGIGGVKEDREKAVFWLSHAAKGGFSAAQDALEDLQG